MWKPIVSAALALLLLGGCAATRFEQPTLDVLDVQMLRGDLLRQELRVRMRVFNPNNRSLPVRSITYAVQLAGENFAQGESDRDFVVPANGSTEFDVNLSANAAATALRLLGSGRSIQGLEYRVTGRVALSKGVVRSIPFDKRGELNLR